MLHLKGIISNTAYKELITLLEEYSTFKKLTEMKNIKLQHTCTLQS